MNGSGTVFMGKHEVKIRPLFYPVIPACPTDNSGVKMNMRMQHWWNDTDRGKLKCWERNIIQRWW
jgi:hypothetical protein